MKSTTVALISLASMLLTGVSVYALTPAGGFRLSSGDEKTPVSKEPETTKTSEPEQADLPAQSELGRFISGSTLMVEGRLGHPKIVAGSRGETFVMLEVQGAAKDGAKVAAPVNVSIVIDRSGSMKGSRIANAISAATQAVDRLNDGDFVSVVTFDTKTSVVVPPTAIAPGTRERVNADIRAIVLGGDTCVSCGVEEGLSLLDKTSGRINRMIVLSDGDTNHGVRDVPGFRSIGERARSRGSSITTIGVDVEYNEKILAALSQESNGRHYFVENDSGLQRIFETEAESLLRSIASDAEAEITLAAGVELDRVLDRSFRREGNKIIVPLGTFESGELKTVLMKLRAPAAGKGEVNMADVRLRYRDLVLDKAGVCEGKLRAEAVEDPSQASELDPIVLGRINRSETAGVLKEANQLFEQGRFDEARRKLEAQTAELRAARAKADAAAPQDKKSELGKDFEGQIAALEEASSGFSQSSPVSVPGDPLSGAAPSPQKERKAKTTVRKNQTRMFEFAL